MNAHNVQLQADPAATVDALFDAFDAPSLTPCTILPNSPWRPVTAEQPPALQDVMVSAYAPDDKVPHTFMAWRTHAVYGPAKWMLSGTDCEELRMQVYAFAPVIEPAPIPTQLVTA
jgi:hypothetical protein